MICVLCRHEKSDHDVNKIKGKNVQYCWSCNKEWPTKFETVHDFTDNLKYLENLYNQRKEVANGKK